MRFFLVTLIFFCTFPPAIAQDDVPGPSDPKAQKTFKQAKEYLQHHMTDSALDDFKKADKQDHSQCVACQQMMLKYGIALHDWKAAETGAEELVAEARGARNLALAHHDLGIVLMYEGMDNKKEDLFTRAHEQLTQALVAFPNFPDAVLSDGMALAHLKQDDAAKAQFQKFITMKPADDPQVQRAKRYIAQPELARARMAPAFAVTTLDGQRISLDGLTGKVVLIDFWATWCGPCRAALPTVKKMAKKFQGEPLVILSISLDNDEQKWKDFVAKNEMTWPQYYDGGFPGSIATLFGVKAIPHTFTIDADGVLQDEQIGDASEGKLKNLVAHARELQTQAKQ